MGKKKTGSVVLSKKKKGAGESEGPMQIPKKREGEFGGDKIQPMFGRRNGRRKET